jgi:hypothetical protein
MVEHKFIPADIAFFFQKKLTGHAVDIGVVPGLHQAGHEQRLVVPDAARLPLEADIGGVLLGQHRLIGVQPAALAGVTKQSDQFVLMRPLDPVQVE